MSTPQVQYPFDTRPLTQPVDHHAAAVFAKELRSREDSSPATAVIGWVFGVLFGVVALIMALGTFAGGLISFSAGDGNTALFIPSIIALVVAVLAVFFFLAVRRRKYERQYRLHLFAQANNMTYEGRGKSPSLPGMIFNLGNSRFANDRVRGHSPRFVEFGNYQYTEGSGDNATTYRWGYVAVKLDVPLPNIVLDALGNNSLFGSNLPTGFRKDQRLSLEGNFDQFFALYCPQGYETDALYLFTPDIMARFIDHAAQLDVEIVDDWLFLYTQRPVSTLDAPTWAWLFSAVGAMLDKFDQWARWRDERLLTQTPTIVPGTHQALPFAAPAAAMTPPPGVAAPGRRLRRQTKWVPIIAGVGFAVVWITIQILRIN